MLTPDSKARRFLRNPLVGNALALYAIQGLNYLLPLALLPYLLRVLGAQSYGALVLSQALMGYAVVLTDFGFNFTAARDVSIARGDPKAVAQIYWTTVAAKGLLLAVAMLVLTVVVLAVPSFRIQWPVFMASSLMVFGNAIFPQWYLQGLERLKDAALIQSIAKIVLAAFARRRLARGGTGGSTAFTRCCGSDSAPAAALSRPVLPSQPGRCPSGPTRQLAYVRFRDRHYAVWQYEYGGAGPDGRREGSRDV